MARSRFEQEEYFTTSPESRARANAIKSRYLPQTDYLSPYFGNQRQSAIGQARQDWEPREQGIQNYLGRTGQTTGTPEGMRLARTNQADINRELTTRLGDINAAEALEAGKVQQSAIGYQAEQDLAKLNAANTRNLSTQQAGETQALARLNASLLTDQNTLQHAWDQGDANRQWTLSSYYAAGLSGATLDANQEAAIAADPALGAAFRTGQGYAVGTASAAGGTAPAVVPGFTTGTVTFAPSQAGGAPTPTGGTAATGTTGTAGATGGTPTPTTTGTVRRQLSGSASETDYGAFSDNLNYFDELATLADGEYTYPVGAQFEAENGRTYMIQGQVKSYTGDGDIVLIAIGTDGKTYYFKPSDGLWPGTSTSTADNFAPDKTKYNADGTPITTPSPLDFNTNRVRVR